MAAYQILYWHDIPVQVRAGGRRDRVSAALPDRFQEAVDKAAMRANLTGSDAYTDGYHWGEPQEREGSAEEVAKAVTAELTAQFEEIDWRNTAEKLLDETHKP
ncbi:MAG: virulence factor [Candidatus Promineifilaceae bacterium]